MSPFIIRILSLLFLIFPLFSYSRIKTKIYKIVDGDTIRVILNGEVKNVRLIGIDCPESRMNPKTQRDALKTGRDIKTIIRMGKRVTKHVKEIIKKGSIVLLEFDVQRFDKYGRILAYVYLKNGKMLNELIVRYGFANVMTVPPNVRYARCFRKAFEVARRKRLGLWGK